MINCGCHRIGFVITLDDDDGMDWIDWMVGRSRYSHAWSPSNQRSGRSQNNDRPGLDANLLRLAGPLGVTGTRPPPWVARSIAAPRTPSDGRRIARPLARWAARSTTRPARIQPCVSNQDPRLSSPSRLPNIIATTSSLPSSIKQDGGQQEAGASRGTRFDSGVVCVSRFSGVVCM